MSRSAIGSAASRLLLAGALLAHGAIAGGACESPAPGLAQGAEVQDTKPQVTWPPVQGATAYRVRLESRIPNGRVIARHDAVVNEPRFVPPQPLADHRAKVTVRLTAICGKQTSAESVSWFTIDTAAACREEQDEVRAHALTDGRLIGAQDARTTAHVQSTRPLCAGGWGEATYRAIFPN